MPRKKTDAQEHDAQRREVQKQDAQEHDVQKQEECRVSIEENFIQLEEIIRKLEAGDSKLEESFTCYEAGMMLVKSLNGQIDKVEKQIQILSEGDENER